jgi:outer membrane protein OmpA-like peptidoglycan-associated protein
VVITGHCDASEANPAALAKARAKAAVDKLRSLGVPKSIVFVVKDSPELVVPTAPGASEPINRQVAITF